MLKHAQTPQIPTSTSVVVFPFSLFPTFGPDTGGGAGQDAPLIYMKTIFFRPEEINGKGGKRYPVFPDENPIGGGTLRQIIGESTVIFADRHVQSAWERRPWFPDDDPQPVGERHPWFPDEDGDKGGKRAALRVWMLDGAGGVQ
jgi:hypothetical protein